MNARPTTLSMLALLVPGLALFGGAPRVSARAMEWVDRDIRPPIVVPPIDPGPPAPRPALAMADVRGRLSTLGPRVDECFNTHFEGERAPRAFPITVFVHADGRWSLGFGSRVRAPRSDQELRGSTPLEVCVADWVSGEIGPRLQPPGGRATRRVAVSFRPQLATVPARP